MDLWSVGAIMYELLTGKTPYDATNHIELLKLIESSREIEFPSSLSVPAKNLLMGLLQKDPAIRITHESLNLHPFLSIFQNDLQSNGCTFYGIGSTKTNENVKSDISVADKRFSQIETPLQNFLDHIIKEDSNSTLEMSDRLLILIKITREFATKLDLNSLEALSNAIDESTRKLKGESFSMNSEISLCQSFCDALKTKNSKENEESTINMCEFFLDALQLDL